jgi:hypothetical protein
VEILIKESLLRGMCFALEAAAISWRSSLQGVVAQSTTEAEYIAVSEGFKEAQWLKGFVSELVMEECFPTVYCDSQSAIDLASHQNCYYRRTKHIEIKYHYIRDIIEKGKVLLDKVHTEDNSADMLTKSLPTPKFEHCSNLIGCF